MRSNESNTTRAENKYIIKTVAMRSATVITIATEPSTYLATSEHSLLKITIVSIATRATRLA